MEIDHEIFSTVILLLNSADSRMATSESMCSEYWLTAKSKLAQEKGVVRLADCFDMTIADDWDVKPQTKQTKKKG